MMNNSLVTIIGEDTTSSCRKIAGKFFYINVEEKKLPFGISYKRASILGEDSLCSTENPLGVITQKVYNSSKNNEEIFEELTQVAINYLKESEVA